MQSETDEPEYSLDKTVVKGVQAAVLHDENTHNIENIAGNKSISLVYLKYQRVMDMKGNNAEKAKMTS